MKYCTRCDSNKDESEFNIKTKGRLQPYCKVCNSLYLKNHYKNNKEKYIKRNKVKKKFLYEKFLDFMKDKFCADCGISDHRVLEFDHLRDKKENISKCVKEWVWEKTLKEMEKCEIVCCNCHRIRTLTRINSKKMMASSVTG